ncbi:MAG: hypothetical protein N0A24_07125 [Armatimonadetes bacterium]|nr:hypothetical protein [Armatimonadota bacterium]MDW8153973.1 hypothetical protein [Armatimonadota bacterium]
MRLNTEYDGDILDLVLEGEGEADTMWDLEDYVEAETAIAFLASALLFSPRVRRTLRQGLVYGIAGALAAAATTRTLLRGVRDGLAGSGARPRSTALAGSN